MTKTRDPDEVHFSIPKKRAAPNSVWQVQSLGARLILVEKPACASLVQFARRYEILTEVLGEDALTHYRRWAAH